MENGTSGIKFDEESSGMITRTFSHNQERSHIKQSAQLIGHDVPQLPSIIRGTFHGGRQASLCMKHYLILYHSS